MADAGRGARVAGAVVLLALALVACGKSGSPPPTPTAALHPVPRPTVPAATHAPAPNGPTAGALSQEVVTAWAGVRTYRSTFASAQSLGSAEAAIPGLRDLAGAIATPIAGLHPGTRVVVTMSDDVIRGDRKHRVVVVNGQPVFELVAVGTRVFARQYRPAASGRGTLPGAWSELDRAKLDPTTPLAQQVASLDAAGDAPFARIPTGIQAQPLKDAGTSRVAGRACTIYSAVTTTSTGEPVDVAIAVGADRLPCSIQTRAGGIVAVTTFERYNQPLTIAMPTATSGPAARVGSGDPLE